MPFADKPAAQLDASNAVSLGPRIHIFPASPLPEYNAAGGPAYAAHANNDARSDLVAILCNTNMPTRANLVNSLRALDNAAMLRLREGSTVFWPASNAYHFTIAYERPLAPRYWQSLDETHTPLSEDVINRSFITPIIGALAELQRIGVTHGGIRPTNIFWRDGASTAPQLGEFISAPAGIGQPILFEPLERAMCSPMGRGPGQHVDDTYALGITVAIMVLGRNPMQGMTDQAIMQTKMEHGTFGAMVGNQRLVASHIELLRGLLTDDSRQRWTAADLQEWINGRRLTPKNSESGRRANRSFEFAGKSYWHVRHLASAMAGNVPEAVHVIENNQLGRWIARSLDDQIRSAKLTEAIESLKEGGKGNNYEEQLVSRACIALDPPAPIRYRGIAVMPDGIAVMLAHTLANGGNTQAIAEIIAHQVVTFWVNAQKESKIDWVPIAQQLERLRPLLEKSQLGNGMERALYELNPTMACASPILRGQSVTSAKMMLPALERVAGLPNRPADPVDRHIAAFLVVHDRHGERLFAQMSPPNPEQKRGLAILTLFAEMQYKLGPEQLPGIAKWILPSLEGGIKRLFNKPLQEKIRRQLKDVSEQGSLSQLQNLVDNTTRLSKDEAEFLTARLIYQNVVKEIETVTENLTNREHFYVTLGRPMAASISSLIAIVLIAFVVVRSFVGALLG